MRCVVTTAMTKVDAADERDVLLGQALASYDDELLVVGPTAADPLVEERLPTGLVDDGAEVVVLLAVELARVRAPQQRADLDASTSCRRQQAAMVGPSPVMRSSVSPRQSVQKIRSPRWVAPMTSSRRAK